MASSRYMRSTWMFSAQSKVTMSDFSCIRLFPKSEAEELMRRIRKPVNYFYLRRLRELSDKTIIEIFITGNPTQIRDEAENRASLLERVALISSTIGLKKHDLHRRLGIGNDIRSRIGLAIGSDLKHMSTRRSPEKQSKGIVIDNSFKRRFTNNNFQAIYDHCLIGNQISKRIVRSLSWLFESRREFDIESSFVKTAISLESLLIFAGSEPLSKSMSERVAFLLSPDADKRCGISRIVKKFYKALSQIVHGSNTKKKGNITKPDLLEVMDRLIALLFVTISSNRELWNSDDSLKKWCELEKWGSPSGGIVRPFSSYHLSRALQQ